MEASWAKDWCPWFLDGEVQWDGDCPAAIYLHDLGIETAGELMGVHASKKSFDWESEREYAVTCSLASRRVEENVWLAWDIFA